MLVNLAFCSSSKQNEVKDKFRFTTFVLQFTTYVMEFFLVFISEPRAFRVRAEEADVSLQNIIFIKLHACEFFCSVRSYLGADVIVSRSH